MLKGKKTYIVAALAAVVVFLQHSGYITEDAASNILLLLGAAGAATLSAKINRVQKTLVLFFTLLTIPTLVSAQTTATLEWSYPNVTLTEVQAYAQTVTVNGTTVTAVPTCVAQGTSVVCTVSIPAPTSGSNTVSVSATRGGITAETRITGLDINNAPKNPNNPKAKIVITINITS